MTEHPAVSVVLPTRNRAASLRRAIASVRRQTAPDWELLVVDDGSTDETPHALHELTADERRVRVLRNERSVGAAAARNRGAAAGRAPLLAFIDDDAEWFPTKLERQRAALEANPSSGVAYCPTEFVGPDGERRIVGSSAAAGRTPSRALLRSNDIDTSAVLVRRTDFDAAGGFDERLPRLQDWDLWVRLGDRTAFAFIDEPLARTWYSPGGISTDRDALVEACRVLAEKFQARAGHDAAAGLYALGHVLMIGGAPIHGRRMLLRSLRHRPGPPRRWIMTMLACLGTTPYGWASNTHERLRRPSSPERGAA